MKKDFAPLLLGRDLRSNSRSDEVVRSIEDQESFDDLFKFLLHHERMLVMRAADAIEKITVHHPEFLKIHKKQLLSLLDSAMHKELKWHIALLIPRVDLDAEEVVKVWGILSYWVRNPNESKIVRVNSLQGLFDLARLHFELKDSFDSIMEAIAHEQIPSLQARVRKLSRIKK